MTQKIVRGNRKHCVNEEWQHLYRDLILLGQRAYKMFVKSHEIRKLTDFGENGFFTLLIRKKTRNENVEVIRQKICMRTVTQFSLRSILIVVSTIRF